jgi:iron complex outermembrane receptor protein
MPRLHALALAALIPLGLASAARAQVPERPDSVRVDTVTPYELPPIVVTATRSAAPPSRLPLAVSVVEGDALADASPLGGLDDALDGVPGVHVANRYNFSLDARLSVRGFGSRANFGSRGVRVLLDGVPQTLPDGQSQFTNVDWLDVERIEVLRGTASALHGNASGGVIALRSAGVGDAPFSQEARVEGGAFGTLRWRSRTAARRGPLGAALTVSRLTTDGFREHSAADLRQLAGQVELALSPRTVAALRLGAADQPRADNPGALTAAELVADPRAAAPNNLLRLAGKAVSQQQLALTLRREDGAGEYGLVVYGLRRDLDNPLATGTFVAIDRRALGARLDLSRRLGAGAAAPRLALGVDLQAMRDDRVNAVSAAGRRTDTLLLDQRERVRELGPFAQLLWSPVPRLLLQGGVRYDRVAFEVDDRFLADGDDGGRRTMDAWSGSGGASWSFGDALIPYAVVSTAFETPTTTELANRPDGAGGLNPELAPQRALSVELGARGRLAWAAWSAAAFTSAVRDAIVPFAEIGGRSFFRNAGRVRQRGVELGLTARPHRAIALSAAYTWADHRFTEYRLVTEERTDTLDGRRVPGVPQHSAHLSLRVAPGGGWSATVEHAISSFLWADDANTIRAEGWGAGVTDVRVGWTGTAGRVELAPFAAVSNLGGRRYVSSVTVNGFNGRVFEPAPGRTLHLGLEARFAVR